MGLAGQLSPQGRVVSAAAAAGRFDEVIGTGFVLAGTVDLSPVLSDELRASLARLGAHVVRFVPPGEGPGAAEAGVGEVAVDVDGFYLPWLRKEGCEAIVVRPDFYLFGTAATAGEVPALLGELFGKLKLTPDATERVTV